MPQILIGAGLALALGALTEDALAGRSPLAVHGGWTIASRHAGVCIGLLILTPIFTGDLHGPAGRGRGGRARASSSTRRSA